MDIHDIIVQYCADNINIPHAVIADKIIEAGDSSLSKRQLRKLIGRYRENIKDSGIGQPGNSTVYTYKGEHSIQSLEDALLFFKVDTTIWDVDRYICNSWDSHTNGKKIVLYQVKLTLNKKRQQVDTSHIKNEALQHIKTLTPKKVLGGSKNAVVVLSDLHIGAEISRTAINQHFDVSTVIDRLQEAAAVINGRNYESVSVCLLGDFIESFTGLNHASTWHELAKNGFGVDVVITAYTVLHNFLNSIHNCAGVYMVSGNHDRVSTKLDQDPQGSVASLLAFMLDHKSSLNVSYNPLILPIELDGIYYILTHNHYNISKGDIGKAFWEYGKQGMYNIMLGGHYHSRKGNRVYTQVDTVMIDQANYRQIAVPPIFTGNFYSESNGWSSSAGFVIIENNGKGKPNVHDYSLS